MAYFCRALADSSDFTLDMFKCNTKPITIVWNNLHYMVSAVGHLVVQLACVTTSPSLPYHLKKCGTSVSFRAIPGALIGKNYGRVGRGYGQTHGHTHGRCNFI